MAAPGPRNLITDVPGLLVGQAEDAGCDSPARRSCSAERPAVAAVDVRGGAPGQPRDRIARSRPPWSTRVDAIVLSGGSAFGLDAAGGVMEGLAAMGRGFEVRGIRVPIVPAAILFDLGFPGRRALDGASRPIAGSAARRSPAPAADFALGNAGAGLGAKAGRLKGGLGSASLRLADGAMVGALVAVNSWGAVVRPDCGRLWAAEQALAGEIAAAAGNPRRAARSGGPVGLRCARGRRQHDDRGGRDRRAARQERLPAACYHGAGRVWRRRSARRTRRSTAIRSSRSRPATRQ